jgi:hypothetical protein
MVRPAGLMGKGYPEMKRLEGLTGPIAACVVAWFACGAVQAEELAFARAGAENSENGATERTPIDLFQAMSDRQIDVQFIAKSDRAANLIMRNRTNQPLTIRLPEAFAGVPVLAQQGNFGGGGGGNFGGGGVGGGGGTTQSVGGGFGGGGLGGGGGGGFGGGGLGGGFFSIAPEKVGKIKVPCVCLDHGKPDPNPRVPYEIRPVESHIERPAVIEVIKAFGAGLVSQRVAQAAVWHLNNDVAWESLAEKRRGGRTPFGGRPPYFHPDEIRLAMRLAAESTHRANWADVAATSEATAAESDENRYELPLRPGQN